MKIKKEARKKRWCYPKKTLENWLNISLGQVIKKIMKLDPRPNIPRIYGEMFASMASYLSYLIFLEQASGGMSRTIPRDNFRGIQLNNI